MIRLHHLEKSRSHRILWLLEHLSLAYEVVTYRRDPDTLQAPVSLREVHPLGKSPVLSEGDRVVAESGAIIDYLLRYHADGRGQPVDDDIDGWINHRYWMHYAEGSLMPLLVMRLVFAELPRQSPLVIKPIASGINLTINKRFLSPQLKLHLAMIEAHLQAHGQFGNDWPSGPDVQMSFPLQALALGDALTGYPSIKAYLAKVDADPAWQRVVEKAGPVSLPG